jgi:hypothetical protein
MMKKNWCYSCYNFDIICDANECNGCKQNANDHLPPSKFKDANIYGDLNKKEEKNMIVTIIGSLTKKKEMDEIKAFWESRGAVVNSPGDPEIRKEPLVDIQRTWIEKIEEADLIIAIPKNVAMTANGDSKYVLEFGESTSYEMAIARRFNKTILFG